ncbi:putative MFS family arabinose efflux permease [Phyllobacterium myrsinacearum]|uniref:MFS transporter n=1 Tax=Phyllobacterium myrsinacearum TaxID=28101 RepID=UPI001029B658|nr:MFS transporter [Phyllobacterium myrsinacearum]RZS79603.1 putative MFS family arabinose efflux permease [Phyllobacterium myrsinacearum]
MTQAAIERQPVRAALGAFVGTMIEWYDFYIYGTAAALVFGDVFFASTDPVMGVLASLGTFAIGFVARPFGALLFGHFGDKVGRKKSLIITLLLMGIATVLIGLLPGFHSIGLTAAVLLVLLRLVQGIAVGGEWGGAVLIAAEHAPPRWRTFLASAPQYGSPVGLILATLAFRTVSDLPQEDFLSWGWRVPFLLSGVLIIFAFIIRAGINESPELLERLKEKSVQSVIPAKEIFRTKKLTLVLGMGLCLLGVAGFYFITTLMMTFTTTSLGVNRSDMLELISWVGVVELFAFPAGSYIATRYGERFLLVAMAGAALLFAIPMMMLIVSANLTNIYIAILGATVFLAAHYAVMAPFLTRAFPVHLRYTGISLCSSLSGAIFSGVTPVIGVWLVHKYGVQWAPLSFLFIFIAGASFVSSLLLPVDDAVPDEAAVPAPVAAQGGV